MTEQAESRAICVLGAHRSGTSTITRALNLLGVDLGDEKDLIRPKPENPEGFWERVDIVSLHTRVLGLMKMTWATTVPLPEAWYKAEEIIPLKNELLELVKEHFSGRPSWLWKDPRTCLLLQLWKDVLLELAIDLKVVFVVRNPLDVARSLERRDGFTLDRGLGIWFNYTIAALKGATGLDTVFLSYDHFLEDWEVELKKCACGLKIAWPDNDSSVRGGITSFVRKDLRHSASTLDDLHVVGAPQPVIRLYELLLELQAGREWLDADLENRVESLYRDFLGYARLLCLDMATFVDCHPLLDDEATTSTEAIHSLVQLKKNLNIWTQWAGELDEEVKAKKEQVASLQKTLAAQTDLLATYDNRMREVVDSMSWKITRPLRDVSGFIRRLWTSQ